MRNPGDADKGFDLTFASTAGIVAGMIATHANIPSATTVSGNPTATTVVLSAAVIADVPLGSKIAFTIGPPGLQFSVVEALYARGFTSAASVTEFSSGEFQQALTGTVAYQFATTIFTAAQAISPNTPPATSPGSFQPINNGSLVNCIPAPCRSPLGPIEYLHEMLQVSPSGTCKNPLAAPGQGQTTLGAALTQRRGPLGQLAASCANLETPLPLIDLVNECLEYMASGAATTMTGTVYNTPADTAAGYELCREGCHPDKESGPGCHDPAALLSALPGYSTPGTPVASSNLLESNQSVEPAVYDLLETDFSSCSLPYSQALDVNRTYLKHFSTCRFEVMRTFRKCITEFALDPINVPTGFESYLPRCPVRIDIAIEYLGITPWEYEGLFQGVWPSACGAPRTDRHVDIAAVTAARAYGFEASADSSWTSTVIRLPEFLRCACLTYCEFLELWKSQYVVFADGGVQGGKFPDCEPCCPEKHWLQFPTPLAAAPATSPTTSTQLQSNPNGPPPSVSAPAAQPPGVAAAAPPSQPTIEQSLYQLAIFIRLWRKLKHVCCAEYTFAQLRDICDVLQLFNSSGLNSDFVRQLAAFQMLRDQFQLPLVNPADKPAAGAKDADRTQILALWVGESAAQWSWAVSKLVEGVERRARRGHDCSHRASNFARILELNLDAFSVVAGFDPTSSTDTWQQKPTHTLRFAEVLSKLYASRFDLDEVFYLFTTGAQSEAGHLFPLQGNEDAIEYPLSLPEDERHHSLGKLRHKLLEAELSDEDVSHWSWSRIEAALRDDFGYKPADVLAFGRCFFPATLQSAGFLVAAQQRRFSSSLSAAQTTPAMWSTPADGPFQYDNGAGALFIQLPLDDTAVIGQLEKLQALNANEQTAVQDLYFQPRAVLVVFAFLFADFAEAQERLIQAHQEHERWEYFRRQFALCRKRCGILAEHLAAHVDFATHQSCPEGVGDALVILRHLYADENSAGGWEADSGAPPAPSWPGPNGGAFAALLGLVGTGLVREFTPAGGKVIWRDLSGPLSSFGPEPDRVNCPLPTLIPSLGLTLTAAQLANVSILNGIAADSASGEWLGGAQGFTVVWTGVLLVGREGEYEFFAGAPTPEGERPDMEVVDRCEWRLSLTRDGKTRVILNHNWPGQTGPTVPTPHLKSGAYDIVVEFTDPSPPFASKQNPRLHTGLQVKYVGPDTADRLAEIPHNRLFRAYKELRGGDDFVQSGRKQDLGYDISGLANGAMEFLQAYYSSSLRDIRRTYQRAFKALLFARRFPLSAKRLADGHCELGFMLANPEKFAGMSFYRPGGGSNPFKQHAVQFDFNFLPVLDNYFAPTLAQDTRAQPSPQCTAAMFDWWERTFDYVCARDQVRAEHDCELWTLFDAAVEQNPTNPGDLLRRMGARKRDWPLDLLYYQDQFNSPYAVTSSDLADDRWVVRVWRADRLVQKLLQGSSDEDAASARPDLWASDDPSRLVSGQSVTGNANLSKFLCDRFDYDTPRRYEEVRKLNDGLRDRGRRALIAYLCANKRVILPWSNQYATAPRELSELLLLDVETGVCEKASRIEEAITSVQNFVRRARLGLEPTSWTVTGEFAMMWDRRFASFRTWQACKRREIYKENYIEWEDLGKARKIEAFRFLETQLGRNALSVAHPGGLEWWPNERPPVHGQIDLLQSFEVDETRLLTQPREGFNLIATPERDAQPSWLTVVAPATAVSQGAAPGSSFNAASASASSSTTPSTLPLWMESAIRLGRRFIRIAAAGAPRSSSAFDCKCHTGCCAECGRKHAALVDEYYFWLDDGQYYSHPLNSQQNGSGSGSNPDNYAYGFQEDYYSQTDQQSGWQDPTQLPQMLQWDPNPLVRLAWCRVHNGEFQQPHMSTEGVPIQEGEESDISFLGRTADSAVLLRELCADARSTRPVERHVRARFPLRSGARSRCDAAISHNAANLKQNVPRRSPLLSVFRL